VANWQNEQNGKETHFCTLILEKTLPLTIHTFLH